MTEYQDNRQKFEELRKEFPVFCFDRFSISNEHNGIKVQFFFSCGEYKFSPYQLFEAKSFYSDTLDEEKKSLLAFNLGMIELLSYWKAFCSPCIQIKCGSLTSEQEQFWKKLYKKGLGEFLYLNGLKDFNQPLFKFACEGREYKKQKFFLSEDYLVPIGGGKDSVCSLELLKGKGKDITPLIITPRGATRECVIRGGFSMENTFTIKRTIDSTLLDLNKKGFLNGHTPFSAMLAFSCLFASALTKKKYIALSNESSANESTVQDSEVNHQYSKSLEFENDFRIYYKTFIGEEFEYFSLLRPISELRIAKIFSLLDYKDVFKSCNVGSKQDIWCGHCPKCLFAYVILSPFISQEELNNIFGKNMLDDEGLLKEFRELIGEAEVKPFECVGTVEEVNIALAMTNKSFTENKKPYLLDYWTKSNIAKSYLNKNFDYTLEQASKDNNLPNDLQTIFDNIFAITQKSKLSKALQNQRIAIMGMGREGKSTYKLLRELLPKEKLILFDKNAQTLQLYRQEENNVCYCLEQDYKEIDKQSDIVFVTPGIATKDLHDIDKNKLTNQCDYFLRLFGRQSIGISGTKGKSTTATLTYQMLKDQNADVILAGNIGIPFFDIFDSIKENTIIVLELSCHQLEHITCPPFISVLLNIYEEHLDHYLSYEDYKQTKLNLCKYGTKKDYFIYNKEDKEITTYIENNPVCSHLKTFSLKDYIYTTPKYLKGEHNKLNILATLNVVKALGTFSLQKAIDTAVNFKGLEHRLQFVANIKGVDYYNDSISTIPQATLAALNSLGNVSVLILGGMDRGIDYSPLKNIVKDYHIKHIAFVGKAGERMYQIITKESKDFDYLISNDWQEIVSWAKQKAEKGSSVLLSPAASSYDQFKNFEHRGTAFSSLVKQ